jgi:ribosome-associated protein
MLIPVTDTFTIDERDLDERFVRASGPGGQNVNKVATAVELRVDLGRVDWPDALKERVRMLAGSRLSDNDVLLIDSRTFRTQRQNREAARVRLVELLRRASRRPRPRKPSRPTLKSRQARLEGKRARGDQKRSRSKKIDVD